MLVRLCVCVLYKYLNTNANIDHMNGSGVGGVGLGRVGEVGVSIFFRYHQNYKDLGPPESFQVFRSCLFWLLCLLVCGPLSGFLHNEYAYWQSGLW